MFHRKELAKFLSGFLAHDVISHIFLAGSGLLPLRMFGIIVTPEYNAAVIIVWSVVTVALVYYAWFKKK
ncbi:MAG: hypothetical protein WC747_04160 [Candidatus Babeliales bacterium]